MRPMLVQVEFEVFGELSGESLVFLCLPLPQSQLKCHREDGSCVVRNILNILSLPFVSKNRRLLHQVCQGCVRKSQPQRLDTRVAPWQHLRADTGREGQGG